MQQNDSLTDGYRASARRSTSSRTGSSVPAAPRASSVRSLSIRLSSSSVFVLSDGRQTGWNSSGHSELENCPLIPAGRKGGVSQRRKGAASDQEQGKAAL